MDDDVNLCVLGGQLAAAPEQREFQTTRLLRLLLVVRSQTPRHRVDVVPVTWWDPPDHVWGTRFTDGAKVWVSGSVQRRFWEDADGRRSRIEVVAEHVAFPGRDDLGSDDASSG
jgi:single-stranded DNA-binding protein